MCCEEDLCDTLRTKNIISFPGPSCTCNKNSMSNGKLAEGMGHGNKANYEYLWPKLCSYSHCIVWLKQANILVLIMLPCWSTRQKISYDLSCVHQHEISLAVFPPTAHTLCVQQTRKMSLHGGSWDVVHIGSCKKPYSKVGQWKLVMVTS